MNLQIVSERHERVKLWERYWAILVLNFYSEERLRHRLFRGHLGAIRYFVDVGEETESLNPKKSSFGNYMYLQVFIEVCLQLS